MELSTVLCVKFQTILCTKIATAIVVLKIFIYNAFSTKLYGHEMFGLPKFETTF